MWKQKTVPSFKFINFSFTNNVAGFYLLFFTYNDGRCDGRCHQSFCLLLEKIIINRCPHVTTFLGWMRGLFFRVGGYWHQTSKVSVTTQSFHRRLSATTRDTHTHTTCENSNDTGYKQIMQIETTQDKHKNANRSRMCPLRSAHRSSVHSAVFQCACAPKSGNVR